MTTLEEVCGPAEIYDVQFVPALFAQWGPVVAGEAGVQNGDRVLDVACGTGALTLAAAEIAGPSGSVVGLDANPEMLAVARRKPVQIEWLEGTAEALPLPNNSFDAVVSQFGLMFFEDKPKALAEMMRVLRPGGRLAVAVCDAVRTRRVTAPSRCCSIGCSGKGWEAPSARHSTSAMLGACMKSATKPALRMPRSSSATEWSASNRSMRWYRPNAPACGRSAGY
nr:class I SAM-dependent methyltransferase [Mesorhizobium ciceri]